MITQSRLREVLSYDSKTGVFRNRTTRAKNCPKGAEAGSIAVHGYRRITVDGISHYAHRLAWLFVNGRMPTSCIDHIDGNRSNNAIANLREASRSENQANRRALPGRKLPKNVYWHKKSRKWAVNIAHKGKLHYFGLHGSVEEAAEVASSARRNLHGKFAAS